MSDIKPENKRIRFWAIVTLVFSSIFLTEVLTGNTPLKGSNAFVLLLFILVYGFPVLLIREIVAKYKLNIYGLLLLGLAYGFYNEGICAKTLLSLDNVPLDVFNHYGIFFGINIAWVMVIVPWHSLHSVAFPILLNRWLFPQTWDEEWFSLRSKIILLTIVSGFGILSYFAASTGPSNNTGFKLLLFIGIMAVLFIAANKFRGHEIKFKNGKLLELSFFGFIYGFLSLLFIPGIFAGGKLPFIFYLISMVLCYFFTWWILRRQDWLGFPAFLVFGSGSYLLHGIVRLILISNGKFNPIEGLFVGMAAVVLFMFFISRIKVQMDKFKDYG